MRPQFCSSQSTLLFYFIPDASKELKYEDKIAENSLREAQFLASTSLL
jgi:hypothetical protein